MLLTLPQTHFNTLFPFQSTFRLHLTITPIIATFSQRWKLQDLNYLNNQISLPARQTKKFIGTDIYSKKSTLKAL